MNSCVATGTDGIPRFSSFNESCKLHVVHDPQSASPSTTACTLRSFSIMASGAGLAKVGFISRVTCATPCRSLSSSSKRSRKMLPPGLLISRSAIVFPASDSRRGADRAALRAVSFLGSTKVKGIQISSHRIRHHLAAARSGRPTPDHRRKLPRRAARYHQVDRFRRTELLVTRLAMDGHLLVQVNVLRTFAAVGIGIRTHGNAGIFKQEVAHITLAPSVAMDSLHV